MIYMSQENNREIRGKCVELDLVLLCNYQVHNFICNALFKKLNNG